MPEEIVKIVIPSMGRPNQVHAYAIPNSIICVPDSEVDQYAQNYDKDRIVSHPDSVIGIGAKRNWIIKNYDRVCMIDDDIPGLKVLFKEKGNVSLSPEETYEIIQSNADTALQLGAKMFGFNYYQNPTYYDPNSPFAFTKVPLHIIGVLGPHEIYIPDNLVLNEDDFLALYCIYKYRYIFIDQRFAPNREKNKSDGPGGCSTFRVKGNDIKMVQEVQRYFGSKVYEMKQDEKGYKGKIRIPY